MCIGVCVCVCVEGRVGEEYMQSFITKADKSTVNVSACNPVDDHYWGTGRHTSLHFLLASPADCGVKLHLAVCCTAD